MVVYHQTEIPPLETLVNDYGRLVSSICRRMIQNEETAQDAAQEVWLQVLKSLPSFRGEAKLSTWIYAIARRVVLDFAQKERLYATRFLSDFFHGETHDLPHDPRLDKDIWVKEMCDKCMTGMLHCLDNETRLAYILRDIAELPYGDIAVIFDQDEPAIRQTISRARRKLRHFLEDECALFNPNGACRCRMKKWVKDVHLPQEYAKLCRTVRSVNLFRDSEIIFLRKNYWEKYL